MANTTQMDAKEIERLLEFLEEGEDADGEETFSKMLDDLLYLAALMDTQNCLLRLALSGGVQTPESLEEFAQELMGMADQVLEKWEVYAQPFA